MPDQQPNNHPPTNGNANGNGHINDISHLFLSNVRDLHAEGRARPVRRPPGAPPVPPRNDVSLDLTPEEFAQVFGAGEDAVVPPPAAKPNDADVSADEPVRIAPVLAILGAHLNGRQFDRVKEYARHLAADRKRIGLIEVDASEFRLMCFDGHGHVTDAAGITADPAAADGFDPRRMAEAMEELGWDVEQWILLLPNPRVPEARALLRDVRHWVLLSTCDHDGVVSSYRTLKGLADTLDPHERSSAGRPRLSLALLDARDDASAAKVYRKLGGVCQQFLQWSVDGEPVVVTPHPGTVAEHLVMCCRPTRDKGQIGSATQWAIVGDFVARAKAQDEGSGSEKGSGFRVQGSVDVPQTETVPAMSINATINQPAPAPAQPAPAAAPFLNPEPRTLNPLPVLPDDVIDLIGGDATEASVLASVLRHFGGQLIECPIAPPTCPAARLAVNRERRLVLVAVARQGLGGLRSIGQAYRWLVENRGLVAMALPQLAIDAHPMPHLTLLVDQSDAAADTLQPMLQSGHITVQTYRTLRWGGKTGLLLEAA